MNSNKNMLDDVGDSNDNDKKGCGCMPSSVASHDELSVDEQEEKIGAILAARALNPNLGFERMREYMLSRLSDIHSVNGNRMFSIPSIDEIKTFNERMAGFQDVFQTDDATMFAIKPVDDKKEIYRMHAEGHQVLISKYSRNKEDVDSVYASEEYLYHVLCMKKQPIVIDTSNLSKIQLSGILRSIIEIDQNILVSNVQKNGREVLIAKYKE